MFEFAKVVREVFLEYRDSIDLPFFYSFPKNSCESASYFLAALLAQKFPEKEFFVVHGYQHRTDENHFWVEVDGKIIDITADQFKGVKEPLYGVDIHPLVNKFKAGSKIEALRGINKFDLVENERKQAVYGAIHQLIQERT